MKTNVIPKKQKTIEARWFVDGRGSLVTLFKPLLRWFFIDILLNVANPIKTLQWN